MGEAVPLSCWHRVRRQRCASDLVEASEAGPMAAVRSRRNGHRRCRMGPGLHTDLESNGSYASPMSFIKWRALARHTAGWSDTVGAHRSGAMVAVQNHLCHRCHPRSITAWSVFRGDGMPEYAVHALAAESTSTAVHSQCKCGPKNCGDLPHSTLNVNRSRSWALQLWLGPDTARTSGS